MVTVRLLKGDSDILWFLIMVSNVECIVEVVVVTV